MLPRVSASTHINLHLWCCSGQVDEKATQLHAIASLKVLLDATRPQNGAATSTAARYSDAPSKETTLQLQQSSQGTTTTTTTTTNTAGTTAGIQELPNGGIAAGLDAGLESVIVELQERHCCTARAIRVRVRERYRSLSIAILLLTKLLIIVRSFTIFCNNVTRKREEKFLAHTFLSFRKINLSCLFFVVWIILFSCKIYLCNLEKEFLYNGKDLWTNSSNGVLRSEEIEIVSAFLVRSTIVKQRVPRTYVDWTLSFLFFTKRLICSPWRHISRHVPRFKRDRSYVFSIWSLFFKTEKVYINQCNELILILV